MLETGMKNTEKVTVDETNTASKLGSGLLDVFATPAMIALMESTCKDCVQDCLEEGKGTVGISISVNHKAATPVGMEVTCQCELVEIDRSRLVFKVKCFDEVDEIGEGTHERFIIDNERFMSRVQSKKEKLK